MEIWVLFLVFLLTAAALVTLVYLFLKRQQDVQVIALQKELKLQRQEYFLPARLEAYQRCVLLMDRMHPANLVLRNLNPAVNATAQQALFLKSIREEMDHNVAQQLFISASSWEMMRVAKEESTRLINLAATAVGNQATASELGAKILELQAQIGQAPTEIAAAKLKEEFQFLLA
ncbi:MAG: hypothetical protein RLZZ301_1241 [Bacteroidota bacterium]|jgi:hypothetical protein